MRLFIDMGLIFKDYIVDLEIDTNLNPEEPGITDFEVLDHDKKKALTNAEFGELLRDHLNEILIDDLPDEVEKDLREKIWQEIEENRLDDNMEHDLLLHEIRQTEGRPFERRAR